MVYVRNAQPLSAALAVASTGPPVRALNVNVNALSPKEAGQLTT
jgi:hypothetical protein